MTTSRNTSPNQGVSNGVNGHSSTPITDQPQVPLPEELRSQLPTNSRTSSSNGSHHKRNFLKKVFHHEKKDKEQPKQGKRSSTIHRSETHSQEHREIPQISQPKRSNTAQHLTDGSVQGKIPTNNKNPFLISKNNASSASIALYKDDANHGNAGIDVAGSRDKPPQLPTTSSSKNGIYIPANPEGMSVSRAASFNNRAALGSKAGYGNPYGQGSNASTNHISGASTTGGSMVNSDDEHVLLPIPVQDPNNYLPDEYKQPTISVHDDYIIPEKNTKRLGDGGSSVVFIITSKKNGKQYAYKNFTMVNHETPEEFYKRAAKEYIIARRLSENKHVVGCYQLMKSSSTTNIQRGWGFVLEFCKGGDLFSLISRTGWKQYPIAEKYCIFKQITRGLKFIHSQGIVHRDLKPENCLVMEDGCIKLTDFGVAEYGLQDPNDLNSPIKLLTTYVGSPPYVSPEVMELKGTPTSAPKAVQYDGFKLDIWALGVLLYCMVHQGNPFVTSNSSDGAYRDFVSSYITYCQSNPQFKTGGDKTHGPGPEFRYAKDYLCTGGARVGWRLLDPSPKTRISLDAVMEDPWFKSIETCIQEDEDDSSFEPKFIIPDSRISSFESGSTSQSKSMLDFSPPEKKSSFNQSATSSGKSSPLVKPKSMLDFNDVAPQSEQLPPLEEVDHEETHSSQLELNIEPKKTITNDKTVPEDSEVFYEASEENSPKLSPKNEPIPQIPNNSSYNITSIPNGSQSSIPRAGSFSSLVSKNSNTSIHGKKKRHHHLDITNVQNHGHGSSVKLGMR
ncbi:RAC serine/threonine-protein kinase [Wickerhamomyces ciferrii]|uniref:non-specific serine/threonine protein kinase n=1 Tax=Wickerhamomyces ciferrii (strain ATCC 14091 / BCRC 22168 / CBS 111 / JCM 3599 / NBRC 0793 / NRRL Y-1031 F-60-10) TaxID=1206466 RepID=K0KDI1_WICCF|nr:RAC serine/threonine-protein kinase [Wickerhamomyces ciferrii]CCH43175.1 RAC serine/threonine-protein kinase [Wickerhamomyces ciferrii]